jgi:hypothetical protein
LAASLAIPNPSSKTEFECTIEGSKGSVSISISGNKKISEELIDSCLKNIGSPEKIHFVPKKDNSKISTI